MGGWASIDMAGADHPPSDIQFTSSTGVKMSDLSKIIKAMTVVGADGVKVGVVAEVVGQRIKLQPNTIGDHAVSSHFIPGGLVADIEGNVVRLSATGANAMLLDEEEDGSMAD
ncbi:hypothetical protein GCM10007913_00970 [Devosia yakushimensis]|uniref:PRC-barrel domain-containing protein n=1 Tax=Devosia yakushimensis TaxID=470028 RepID=A0ABQ5U8X3_9HYPH|nr:hypothetical protein GCM10007913_00970 [Devosia yakushimensis]